MVDGPRWAPAHGHGAVGEEDLLDPFIYPMFSHINLSPYQHQDKECNNTVYEIEE